MGEHKVSVVETVREMERQYDSVLEAPEAEIEELQGVASGSLFLAYVVDDKFISVKSTTLQPRLTIQRSKAYRIDTDDEGEDLLPYLRKVFPDVEIKYV